MARSIIGLIFILLGLSALFGFDLGRFIGPLFLIFIGWLILTRTHGSRLRFDQQSASQDLLNEVFIFSGTRKSLNSQNFEGGKLTVVFGGADLDLREVKTEEKMIELELTAVFGSIHLTVPENWQIIPEAVGILGGVENKTSAGETAVKVKIKGAAVFGGIEITN